MSDARGGVRGLVRGVERGGVLIQNDGPPRKKMSELMSWACGRSASEQVY